MGEIGANSGIEQTRTKSDSTTTTRQAAGEQELTDQQQGTIKKTLPGYEDVTQAGLGTLTSILGGQGLGGYLNRLPQGINPEVTQSIVDKSLADIRPGLEASGIYDSGIRAELEAQTASGIRQNAEESNLNRIQNLLQLAISGVPGISANVMNQQQLLAQRLAGLRQVNTASRSRSTTANYDQSMKFKL